MSINDPLGRFSFDYLPPGSMIARVKVPDRPRTKVGHMALFGGKTYEELTFVLPTPRSEDFGRIVGTIQGPTNLQKDNLSVYAYSLEGHAQQKTEVDRYGKFTFKKVLPGKWRLTLTAYFDEEDGSNQHQNISQDTLVQAGEQSFVDFNIEKGARISGQVLDKGRPHLGLVFLFPEKFDSGITEMMSSYDSNGFYVFPEIPPARYSLFTYFSGKILHHSGIKIQGNENLKIDLDLPKGSLSGTIKDKAGNPVFKARVMVVKDQLRHISSVGEFINYFGGETKTDKNGNFEINGLSNGNYLLKVLGPNGHKVLNGININEEEAPKEISMELDQGGFIHGKILDPNGNGIAKSTLFVMDEDENTLTDWTWNLSSTDGGFFQSPSFHEGKYSILVQSPGYGLQYVSNVIVYENDQTELNITLVPEVKLQIQVVDQFNRPIGDAKVLPFDEKGKPFYPRITFFQFRFGGANVYTDKNGLVELKNLVPRKYNLLITLSNGKQKQTEVIVGESNDFFTISIP